MTISDLYQQLFGKNHINDGDVIEFAEHGRVGGLSTGQGFKYTVPIDPSTGNSIGGEVDITTNANYARKYYTNAGAVTDGIVWSPAAGKRWHIVALHIQVSAATTVTLEDDKSGGDEAFFKAEYAANSGEFLVYPKEYPLASLEDAADLIVTTTAGNIYITAVGYEV